MKHKIPFLLRTLIFLAIVGLSFNILQSLLYQETTMDTPAIEAVIESQETLDIVIIGSSHAYGSFDPMIIDNLLENTSSVNLSAPKLNPIQSLFLLNAIIDQGKIPNVVVLELFSAQYDLSGVFQVQFFNDFSKTWHWKYLVDYLRFHHPEQYLSGGLFPLITQHEHWKTPKLIEENLFSNHQNSEDAVMSSNTISLHRGFRSLPKILTADSYQDALSTTMEITPYEGNRKAYQEILALRDLYGFKLIFVYSSFPMSYQSDLAQLDMMMQSLDEPYYNLNTGAQEQYTAVDFFDRDHTNAHGAIPASITLAEILSAELERPLDETRIAPYNQLRLEDINIQSNGTQVTVTLIPASATADWQVDWVLSSEEGQRLLEQSGTLLSFSFPSFLLADKKTDLSFTIRQEGLDYPLTLSLAPEHFPAAQP